MMNPIIPFYKQADVYIEKGEECYLYDSENKAYIDFEAGDWAACLGHTHPKVNNALNKQLQKVMHDGLKFKSKIVQQLSFKLLNLLDMPNGGSVFLNSGSEAVNMAITMAQKLTCREKIVKIEGSYLSAFGYGSIVNQNHINIALAAKSVDNIDFSEVAAFVFEAGSSHGLVKFCKIDLIDKIIIKAREHNCLLIANEVTLGFGRTGKWFGYQHYDYKPDLVALGKSLGNGYPISAVCINNKVANIFAKNQFRYAQSHQNDPLGCAVANEVIDILEKDKLIDKSEKLGIFFLNALTNLKHLHPSKITEIRGRGLILALELNSNISGEIIGEKLLNKGFIVGYSKNLLRFMPPLIIQEMEIVSLISALETILEELY